MSTGFGETLDNEAPSTKGFWSGSHQKYIFTVTLPYFSSISERNVLRQIS